MEMNASLRVGAAVLLLAGALSGWNSEAFESRGAVIAAGSSQAFSWMMSPATRKARAEGISLAAISVKGSGCPSGETLVSITPDGAIVVPMKRMAARLNAGRTEDHKDCSVAIPVNVPSGMRVVLKHAAVDADYDLAVGDRAQIGLKAYNAGEAGANVTEDLGISDRSGHATVSAVNVAATGCGSPAILRIRVSLSAARDAVLVTEEASASAESLRLRLAARPCR